MKESDLRIARQVSRGPSIRRRSRVPVLPEGASARVMVERNPGRSSISAPPDKPGAKDTPHRSRAFVPARHSADGNSYKPGEPIPEEEAVRQGVARTQPSKGAWRIPPRRSRPCARCAGRGTNSRGGRRPGHKDGCRCFACAPCPACGGSGYETEG